MATLIVHLFIRITARSWLTILSFLLCGSANAFATLPLSKRSQVALAQIQMHERRPKLADMSAEWPTEIDSWGRHWQEPVYTNSTQMLYPSSSGCWLVSVSNRNPTWERVLAKVLPENLSVTPVSATLAPRGGCDNLCNDEERYMDSCDFCVPYSPLAKWLLIRTEDIELVYFLEKDESQVQLEL